MSVRHIAEHHVLHEIPKKGAEWKQRPFSRHFDGMMEFQAACRHCKYKSPRKGFPGHAENAFFAHFKDKHPELSNG